MEQVLFVAMALLTVAVMFNYVLTFALIRRQNSMLKMGRNEDGFLEPGRTAPDFSAETLEGRTVTRASYAGRAVAFVFFNSQCGPCRESLPTYEALHPKAQQAGIEIVLVSIDDPRRTRAFASEQRIGLPIIIAPEGQNSFKADYKIPGTPAYCLIDAQGIVRSTGFAELHDESSERFIASWETSVAQVA